MKPERVGMKKQSRGLEEGAIEEKENRIIRKRGQIWRSEGRDSEETIRIWRKGGQGYGNVLDPVKPRSMSFMIHRCDGKV